MLANLIVALYVVSGKGKGAMRDYACAGLNKSQK
jgi:hypothetical protein